MKIDTTSTAEPAQPTQPSGAARPHPGLEAPGLRGGHRSTAGSRPPREPSQTPTGYRLWRVLGSFALVLVLLGNVGTGALHLYRWYNERLRDSAIDSTLVAVRARQRQYEKMNQAYAGSMRDLKMKLPSEIARGVRVFAGSIADRPDFLAEYCDGVSCKSIDGKGRILTATLIARPTGSQPLPELKEGQGRLYGFPPPTRR